jgi:3-hydroxybutyryl-CoA dehydrogenase
MVRAGKLGVKSGEGFYVYSESKKGRQNSKQFI